MQLIDRSSIIVPPDRQRHEFNPEALGELQDSIERHGLLHAIVCDQANNLRAGERRLRAIDTIYALGGTFCYNGSEVVPGKVPVVYVSADATDLELFEIELEENLARQDLTWQEKADAVAKLHDLRSRQNPGQTVTATANELYKKEPSAGGGAHITETNKAILVGKNLDKPEVAGAKTLNDAYKALQTIAQKKVAAERAEGMDKVQEWFEAHHANCLEWLAGYQGPKFDVCLTDPPYGVGITQMSWQQSTAHDYDDSPDAFRALMNEWVPLLAGHMQPACHIYQFCDFRWFNFLAALWEANHFEVNPRPLIWHRGNEGRVTEASKWPRRTYECLLYARRGQRPLQTVRADVLIHTLRDDTSKGEFNFHGARKPVELYVDLLERSCLPGDRVIDPFMGSGTIFAAAQKVKVFAVGIEQNADAFNFALGRANSTKNVEDLL